MKKLILAVAMGSAMVTGAANAADMGHGKLTFTGSVIDAACSIDAKSLDQTIPLGAISSKQLMDGGKSTPVGFSIQLHDCDTVTGKNALVTFNGTAGAVDDALDSSFAVTGAPAGTVGVTVTDMGGTVIKPGSASPAQKLNDGDNELQFQAYVQGSSVSNAVPGNFTSVANFVMDYQ